MGFPDSSIISLIKEINELRRELKFTRSQVYDLEAALKLTKKIRPEVSETGNIISGQERQALGSRAQRQPQTGLLLASKAASPKLPPASGHTHPMAFWAPLHATCLFLKGFVRTLPHSNTHKPKILGVS